MTNYRMTNDEPVQLPLVNRNLVITFVLGYFVIRHSFVIGYLVIRHFLSRCQ